MTSGIGQRLKAGWQSLGIDMKMLYLMFKYVAHFPFISVTGD